MIAPAISRVRINGLDPASSGFTFDHESGIVAPPVAEGLASLVFTADLPNLGEIAALLVPLLAAIAREETLVLEFAPLQRMLRASLVSVSLSVLVEGEGPGTLALIVRVRPLPR